jgi:hypothetical protein
VPSSTGSSSKPPGAWRPRCLPDADDEGVGGSGGKASEDCLVPPAGAVPVLGPQGSPRPVLASDGRYGPETLVSQLSAGGQADLSRRCSGDATRAVELVVPGQQGPRAPNTLGETGRRREVDAAWSLTAYQGYSLGWERACVWHDRPMASHQHRPRESGRASRAPPVGGSGLSRQAIPPAEVSLTGDDPDALAAGPIVPVLCRDRP